MKRSEIQARYHRALHAMQSGVAAQMARAQGDAGTDPKHLRVGVNSALCDQAALAKLLTEKGIFTEEEYAEAVMLEMEREVARYEKDLSRDLGTTITLA